MGLSSFFAGPLKATKHTHDNNRSPWARESAARVLQALSNTSHSRPIHTIVLVAIIASISYTGVLERYLHGSHAGNGSHAWESAVTGSQTLRAGPDTAWKWQGCDIMESFPSGMDHFALFHVAIPQTAGDPNLPMLEIMSAVSNFAIQPLRQPSNQVDQGSNESTLVFSVPYGKGLEVFQTLQKLRSLDPELAAHRQVTGKWTTDTAVLYHKAFSEGTLQNLVLDLYDLCTHAQVFDILIMTLAYLATAVTFLSLFTVTRRMGSRFWIAAGVLFSSLFAFLFGRWISAMLGVPTTFRMLAEGLPFLIALVGFEKHLILTRTVLSRTIRLSTDRAPDAQSQRSEIMLIPPKCAIQQAVNEHGPKILKTYVMEIAVLAVASASRLQTNLKHFCFLSVWIVTCDCVLLFSFYSAILRIKLEVNRIHGHIGIRDALIDDGVSKRVADNVAQSSWFRNYGKDKPELTLFGKETGIAHISIFKFLMVTGFLIFNTYNLYVLQGHGSAAQSRWSPPAAALSTRSLIQPLSVASDGLDMLLSQAKTTENVTVVTVVPRISYEYECPVEQGCRKYNALNLEDEKLSDNFTVYELGSQAVGGILKGLEDPALSKWLIAALALSVAFNGYIFSAATAEAKDKRRHKRSLDDRHVHQAEDFLDSDIPGPLMVAGEVPFDSAPIALTNEDVKTSSASSSTDATASLAVNPLKRTNSEMNCILQSGRAHELVDEEVVYLATHGKLPSHSLEKTLHDFDRAVRVRRSVISHTKATTTLTSSLENCKLPYQNYDWSQVYGVCCENVVGYMPIPVGISGPLIIDGQTYYVPMATTEGVLVASTNRGCKSLNAGGGVKTILTADGMTRGPCVKFESLERAGCAKLWLDSEHGQEILRRAFNSTSRFARLESIKTALAGTNLFIRFRTTTGDAMGMNMISKGVEHALSVMLAAGFDDMEVISLSGNYCTDKKASGLNWVDGRGKSVVAEGVVPSETIRKVLKTDAETLVRLNTTKNLIGSAMAASVGGFNAHAANIVAAIFIATGQDPAQVVESANCITTMENVGGALRICVSMPSLEVGTLGGGTILDAQGAMLDILGVRGSNLSQPGDNARRLARIIAATTLAGELSLCSALAAGHLVAAHMQHNRLPTPTKPAEES